MSDFLYSSQKSVIRARDLVLIAHDKCPTSQCCAVVDGTGWSRARVAWQPRYFAVGICCFAVASCQRNLRSAAPNALTPRALASTTASPYEGVKRFPYIASAKKQRLLIDASTCNLQGMTQTEVASKLGEPDVQQNQATKRGEKRGVSFKYYAYRRDKKNVSESDSWLVVHFDNGGRCDWIRETNLQEDHVQPTGKKS